jgi:hypothetical protein
MLAWGDAVHMSLSTCHVWQMHEFLKFLIGDMSRFVPLPEFLEVKEWN